MLPNEKVFSNNVNLVKGEGALPYKVPLELGSKMPNANFVKSSVVMISIRIIIRQS
jgi:hypothetical protein